MNKLLKVVAASTLCALFAHPLYAKTCYTFPTANITVDGGKKSCNCLCIDGTVANPTEVSKIFKITATSVAKCPANSKQCVKSGLIYDSNGNSLDGTVSSGSE